MEKWALGRLEDGPDKERCKAFWRAYRAATREACAGCWAYRVCGGPCPWEVARADGTFATVPRLCKDTCAWIKQGVYYWDTIGHAGQKKGVQHT